MTEERSTKVYCLGRVIVDLYAEQIQTPLSHVSTFRKYLGGSAGNTAFGLARLGADAGLISRVGPDEFGTFLLERLEQAGVSTEMVKRDLFNPTALAFASIFPPEDSKVLFYRKPCADNHLEIGDIEEERLGVMLVLAATALAESPSREAALHALQVNRTRDGLNIVDLDWRPNLWADHRVARLYYRMALSIVDIVIANEPELEFAGESADPETAAANILARGPRTVVAKRGGSGVRLYGEGGPLEIPPFKVDVLNTLGAGDGFGAAYCYGLLQGWPQERILTFAAAAGAIVVSRHSCSEAMPTRGEVEALLGDQGRGV
jgi:5-dehydro-2-deoxygluconokinase